MARLYEMCNEIDSENILKDGEKLTADERKRMIASMRDAGVLSTGGHRKGRRRTGFAAGWAVAAAALLLVIVPNISAEAAYAMEQIPILGTVIRAVTVREYQYEDERFAADIEKVQLEQAGEQEDLQTNESIAVINESIEEMTDRLIARFEDQVALGEGHTGVFAGSEIVTDTDRWFTLRITVTEVAGSGAEYQYYYHIDRTTGEIACLQDLFRDGADYITPISENIMKQMSEQMAADESKIYWIDTEEELGHEFDKIKADQNFYLNDNGQIVICFDEYEVAPGYMGLVEFTIEEEAVADIRK